MADANAARPAAPQARADGRRQLPKTSLARRIKNALHVDQRFFSAYYVLNGSYVFGFLFAHYLFGPPTDPETLLFGKYTIEHQLMLTGAMLVVAKSINLDSWDQWWYWVFFFGKGAALLLSYQNGARWFITSSLVIIAFFVMLEQPQYTGPSNMTFLNSLNFDWLVFDEKAPHDWLVEAYTTWAFSCTQFAPTFAKLSVDYSSDQLKFGKVDVGRFPKIAEKIGIDVSATSRQLPTLIYFSQGKEIARVPEVAQDGTLQPFEMNRRNIVRYFFLDGSGAEAAPADPKADAAAQPAGGRPAAARLRNRKR